MKSWVKIILLLIAVGVIFLFKTFVWDGAKKSSEKSQALEKHSPEMLKKMKGKIVFQSNRSGNNEIFMIHADGSGLRALTQNSFSNEQPSFSPDGKKIVFTSDRFGNKDLFVMNLDGKILNRIIETAEDECDPVWSKDGDRIYFSVTKDRNEDIYFYSFSSQKITRVTDERWRQILPAISPDGRRLALSVNKGLGWHLYLLDLLSGELIQLTREGGNCRPDWSPDGQKIAFVSTRDDRKGDIYIMNADGTGVERVTDDKTTHDYDPAFSPDGHFLVFNKSTHKTNMPWNLWIVDLKTGQKARLTEHPSDNKFPDWQ